LYEVLFAAKVLIILEKHATNNKKVTKFNHFLCFLVQFEGGYSKNRCSVGFFLRKTQNALTKEKK